MSENTTNIGEIPGEGAGRDAIHVAVAPVTAGEQLSPGEHVGFLPNGTIGALDNIGVKLIGIVDPFLKKEVFKGERFWLFLYPNTITNLRHLTRGTNHQRHLP